MTDDSAAILDDLLCRWHQWSKAYSPVRGHNGRALVCGDYRVSRQYDDENGALDDALEARTMRSVDYEIAQLQTLWRIAIMCDAQALCLGVAVYSNPRLPSDRAERAALVGQARGALLVRLVNAGVV